MATNLEALRESIDPSTIRAAGEAARVAVGLTDDELITARASGLGGRPRLERYPLNALSKLRVSPSPSATKLELSFDGTPPQFLALMYDADARADFDRIVALLERVVEARPQRPDRPRQPAAPASGPPAAGEAAGSSSLLRTFGGAIVAFLLLPAALLYVLKLLIE
jgi:hypothetical protein